jgi:hypothetical protein
LNSNFCLFVAKRGKANSHPFVDAYNMVTGKALATEGAGRKNAPSVGGNHLRVAGRGVGFPARMIARLRSVIGSRVPFGYQDTAGFHFGTQAAE